MGEEYIWVAMHLGAAWLAGSLIGLERTFHGRPAGFRTHALVCMASALLMLLTTQQWERLGVVPIEMIRADPMRIAQGIMTGIGFLGAGVIFKEGLTVRGFDVRSIALDHLRARNSLRHRAILSRSAHDRRNPRYARRFQLDRVPDAKPVLCPPPPSLPQGRSPAATDVRRLITEHGFALSHMSYRLEESGTLFEYRMVIRTLNKTNLERLATTLLSLDNVVEFRIFAKRRLMPMWVRPGCLGRTSH